MQSWKMGTKGMTIVSVGVGEEDCVTRPVKAKKRGGEKAERAVRATFVLVLETICQGQGLGLGLGQGLGLGHLRLSSSCMLTIVSGALVSR